MELDQHHDGDGAVILIEHTSDKQGEGLQMFLDGFYVHWFVLLGFVTPMLYDCMVRWQNTFDVMLFCTMNKLPGHIMCKGSGLI